MVSDILASPHREPGPIIDGVDHYHRIRVRERYPPRQPGLGRRFDDDIVQEPFDIRRVQFKELDGWLSTACEAVESIVSEGVEKAMTRFNRRAQVSNTEEE